MTCVWKSELLVPMLDLNEILKEIQWKELFSNNLYFLYTYQKKKKMVNTKSKSKISFSARTCASTASKYMGKTKVFSFFECWQKKKLKRKKERSQPLNLRACKMDSCREALNKLENNEYIYHVLYKNK